MNIAGIIMSRSSAIITLDKVPFGLNTLNHIIESISSEKISIDMISQTTLINGNVQVSFVVSEENVELCQSILKKAMSGVFIKVDKNITKFSIAKTSFGESSIAEAKLFRVFAQNDIEVKMTVVSEIGITCAINNKDRLKALQAAIDEFNL